MWNFDLIWFAWDSLALWTHLFNIFAMKQQFNTLKTTASFRRKLCIEWTKWKRTNQISLIDIDLKFIGGNFESIVTKNEIDSKTFSILLQNIFKLKPQLLLNLSIDKMIQRKACSAQIFHLFFKQFFFFLRCRLLLLCVHLAMNLVSVLIYKIHVEKYRLVHSSFYL